MPAQPLASSDSSRLSRDSLDWNDQLIAEPLMVPLEVIQPDNEIPILP